MLKFLKNIQQLRASADLVVLGNQSADMDSCCTALMTAYLSTEVQNRPCVPLIQIPRADLKLRKDIEYVFRNLGIEESWLLFTDDLPLTNTTQLFLIDHNAPTTNGKPVAVIDHHAIEDPHLDLSRCSPHKIVKSGSCMSAVVNYYAQLSTNSGEATVSDLFRNDPVLAPLALAPIVQDTNNLTSKVEPEDTEAVKFLLETNPGLSLFSPIQEFSTLKSEKRNLEGLSAVDLLRKDYKQWGDIGISSLPKLFGKLKQMDYDIANALEEFATTNNLAVMIGLASGTKGADNKYVRQLAIWGPPELNLLEGCPDLQLELKKSQTTHTNKEVRFYKQLNIQASRKQVAPAVKEVYAKFRAAQ